MKNDSDTHTLEVPRPDFGAPEAEFRPTFGQTAAGLLIHGSCAAALFAYVLFEPQADALEDSPVNGTSSRIFMLMSGP